MGWELDLSKTNSCPLLVSKYESLGLDLRTTEIAWKYDHPSSVHRWMLELQASVPVTITKWLPGSAIVLLEMKCTFFLISMAVPLTFELNFEQNTCPISGPPSFLWSRLRRCVSWRNMMSAFKLLLALLQHLTHQWQKMSKWAKMSKRS